MELFIALWGLSYEWEFVVGIYRSQKDAAEAIRAALESGHPFTPHADYAVIYGPYRLGEITDASELREAKRFYGIDPESLLRDVNKYLAEPLEMKP